MANLIFGGIFGQLAAHMKALDALLRAQVQEFEPEIRDMADYCIDTSGKRIRPALVFLSGRKASPKVAADLVRAAAVVELVHMGSLVHDDIMDGAIVRRNRATAVKAYGTAASVLLGDALFAHALNLAAQFPTVEVCAAVSVSMRRVCAGEIMQTLSRGTTTIDRARYDRIIDLKTAELFRVSCELGAKIAGYTQAEQDAIASYGRHLGIAYQIYDDLADYFGTEDRIGKTLGTDLQSGKVTLPLFFLEESLPASERAELQAEIQGQRPPQLTLRLQQMRTAGVYARVAAEIERELSSAQAALASVADPGKSLSQLGELSDVLRDQVKKLQANQPS